MGGYLDPGSGSYIIQLVVAFGLPFAILFSVLSLNTMKNKGRSKALGFALGFFLGIIGYLICRSVRPNIIEMNKRKVASGKFRYCDKCKELIKSDATVCYHCKSPQP